MNRYRWPLIVLTLALIAFTAPLSAKVTLPKYDALFVFSDSLGDTGNDFILTTSLQFNPAIPPSVSPFKTYFRGRFSNGPILFEHFWKKLSNDAGPVEPSLALTKIPKTGAVSFAYGGSTSGDSCFPLAGLKCQVEQFGQLLGGAAPPRRALYAVFSGANDIILAPNPFDPPVVAGIIANVSAAVARLYELGARDVMVFNMPNLGRSLRVPDFLKAPFNELVQVHNALLADAIEGLSASLPGIRIIPIDSYGFVESLVASSAFNFDQTALPSPLNVCLFVAPAGESCTDVDFNVDPSFFFWDVEHPTKAAHAATGAFVLRSLEAYFAED